MKARQDPPSSVRHTCTDLSPPGKRGSPVWAPVVAKILPCVLGRPPRSKFPERPFSSTLPSQSGLCGTDASLSERGGTFTGCVSV